MPGGCPVSKALVNPFSSEEERESFVRLRRGEKRLESGEEMRLVVVWLELVLLVWLFPCP